MANYRHMRPGFGDWASQLSISGGGESLGWEAAPSGGGSSSGGSSASSYDPWASVVGTAIGTAGQVATSVWGYHQPATAEPVTPGYTPPAGTVMGSLSGVNMNVLLMVGLGALAILMFAGRKAAA